ncbi:MAG: C40 family peptidase [Bacteroidales bacterium]|nr:C40 family peptidase [Bacteroidales bacterium]
MMSNYVFCTVSAAPLRSDPSHRSEMVTQMLFAEAAEILEEKAGWILVRNTDDNYSGWADAKQMFKITREEYEAMAADYTAFCNEPIFKVNNETTAEDFNICLGSPLPGYSRGGFSIGPFRYNYNGRVSYMSTGYNNTKLLKTAIGLINTPYLWGGRTLMGIDCSGFVQIVFKVNGINLLRDAWQQALQGSTVSFLTECEPGDVAFFENEEGKIIHTGILDGEGQIIHASGQVRIDRIDHEGIYNTHENRYTHKLRLIKRM